MGHTYPKFRSLAVAAALAAAQALAADPAPAPAAPAPAEAPPAADAPAASSATPAPAEGGMLKLPIRFRRGFNIGGGVTLGGSLSGVGGAAARFGVQITDMFSAYYQVTALVGGYGRSTSAGGVSVGIFAGAYSSFMAGTTFFDFIDVGFGPSVDVLDILSASAGPGTAGAGIGAGVFFGLDARVALAIPSHKPDGGRSGFCITFDAHPTFVGGGTITAMTVGLGGEWY